MAETKAVYLNEMGLICSLGDQPQAVLDCLLSSSHGLTEEKGWLSQAAVPVGRVQEALVTTQELESGWNTRVNRMILSALDQILPSVLRAIECYGPERVGVVMGTSTSGIAESECALKQWALDRSLPQNYQYSRQELGNVSEFLARHLGTKGPAYTVSTACTSGAKAMAAGRRLLLAGLCDAVIVGGADTLCELTVNGFASLEAISSRFCSPFAADRDGINIGEAAALFLMSREPSAVSLNGVGESSDAYHISAPDPSGRGAMAAMASALEEAGNPSVDYLNLHGTATRQNDAMESSAVFELFSSSVPASSTKGLTGHTLGAAGALEAAFCWLLLDQQNHGNGLPPNLMHGDLDPQLAAFGLLREPEEFRRLGENWMLSNSFAFGGNNIALLLRGEN